MAQYLFLDTDIQVLVDATKRDLLEQIDRLSDSAILSRSNEEWLKDLIDNNTIQVPTLDISKADRTFVDALVPQYQVPNPNFDNQHGVPGEFDTLHIPYSGPEDLFYYKPRIYEMNSVMAGPDNSEITIHVGGAWHVAETIENHFDRAIKAIEANLTKLGSDVAPFNEGLTALIRPRLEARRRSAVQTKVTTDALKYPLRKRDDAPQTYKLPERQITVAPSPVRKASAPGAEPEFTLS